MKRELQHTPVASHYTAHGSEWTRILLVSSSPLVVVNFRNFFFSLAPLRLDVFVFTSFLHGRLLPKSIFENSKICSLEAAL